jgi:hypothetical protein
MKGLFEPIVVNSIHYYGEKLSGFYEAKITQPTKDTVFFNKYLAENAKK